MLQKCFLLSLYTCSTRNWTKWLSIALVSSSLSSRSAAWCRSLLVNFFPRQYLPIMVKKTCLILGRHVVCGQTIIVQYKIIIFTWHVSRVDKVMSRWCPMMSRWGTYLCQTPRECPDYGTYIGPKFCPNLSGCAPTYEPQIRPDGAHTYEWAFGGPAIVQNLGWDLSTSVTPIVTDLNLSRPSGFSLGLRDYATCWRATSPLYELVANWRPKRH